MTDFRPNFYITAYTHQHHHRSSGGVKASPRARICRAAAWLRLKCVFPDLTATCCCSCCVQRMDGGLVAVGSARVQHAGNSSRGGRTAGGTRSSFAAASSSWDRHLSGPPRTLHSVLRSDFFLRSLFPADWKMKMHRTREMQDLVNDGQHRGFGKCADAYKFGLRFSRSCIFQPCDLVRHCLVLYFPWVFILCSVIFWCWKFSAPSFTHVLDSLS